MLPLPRDKVTLARQVLEGYSSQGKNNCVITMERVGALDGIFAGFILGKETFICTADRILICGINNWCHLMTMIVGLLKLEEVSHKFPLSWVTLVAPNK